MNSATESESRYNYLEKKTVPELLADMHREDSATPLAIKKTLPELGRLVEAVIGKMEKGGRLFYIGAGSSGRLGILDAAEIPPTYGLSPGRVVGLIAGGDTAIRRAVEHAEDDPRQAWNDLQAFRINVGDVLVGLSASGKTPYVVGGLRDAQRHGIVTAAITCNADSALSRYADFAIEAVVGPEYVTGSTRMKAGTAQKLILNMISTSVMIKLGHVKGNKMIDMRLSNNKLIRRGVAMLMAELDVSEQEAKERLARYGSVRKALENKPTSS